MAALLALVVFLVAAAIGLALLTIADRSPSAGLLLQAPALGFALLIIVAASLNCAGLPVITFAWPLVAIAIVGSSLVLVRARRIDVRPCGPFLLIAAIAVVLIGWPIFQFGFNWISFANTDMVNYCMEAERFVRHGWDQAPAVSSLASLSDPVQYYWFLNVLVGERYASSELLAVVIAVTGQTGFQIFMPMMLSITAALICAVCGLVYRSERYRSAALLTGALLSINALFALGTLEQLLDQVLGLMLLSATIATIWRITEMQGQRTIVAVVPSVALAGLSYVYPECLPFAFGTCAVFAVRTAIAGKLRFGPQTVRILIAGVLMTVLMLNRYLLTDLAVLRVRAVKRAVSSLLFPYYLVPTGIGNIVGVIPQGTFPSESVANVLIILGAVFMLFGLVAIGVGCIHGEPVAYVGALMAIGIIVFLAERSSFTLFKFAMFVQPFATGALALLVFRLYQPSQFAHTGLAEQ